MPHEKIRQLREKAEKELGSPIVDAELQAFGQCCPHCKSLNLERSKYPRYAGNVIMMMSKCRSCGFYFDAPHVIHKPYVLFWAENGNFVAYALDPKDIEE